MQKNLRLSCAAIFRISSSGRLYVEGVRRAVYLYSMAWFGWPAWGSNVHNWVRGQGQGPAWLAGRRRRLLATGHCRPAAQPAGPGHQSLEIKNQTVLYAIQ
jgi:hypothetical protein